nr:hypothetical protein [Phycisphaerales bacterium]
MSTCSTRTEDPARALWRARLTAPTPIPPHEFDPPPEPPEEILPDGCDPDLPLGDIAHKANTSFESLALWLARPDIAARLDAIESMIRRRLRLSALASANSVLVACTTVMERFSRAPDRGPEDYKDPTTHAIHTRNAANALMAARIHLYTLKLLTQPPRSPKPTTPTPNPVPNPAPTPT